MRNISFAAGSCLAFSVLIMMVYSTICMAMPLNANVTANALKYEPYPAEPGKYFEIWISVDNYAVSEAENLIFELQPSYPFSLDANENATRSFGTLAPVTNAVIRYKVRVAADAVEGWNGLDYRFRIGSGAWILGNFSVYVRSPESVLYIETAETIPAQMVPGSVGVLDVTLKNMGNSVIKDVTVKIDLSSVSIYPIGSATESKIYLLDSGESGKFSFRIMPGSGIDAGAYKIPINISYYDWTGTRFSKMDYITFIVGDVPDIVAGLESTEILAPGESGTVTLRIVNKGLVGLKLLTLNLQPSDNYELLSSSNSVYIGNLESDGYETAEFIVYVNPEAEGRIIFPVRLDYRDDNNKEFSQDFQVEMKLYTAEEISRYGLRQGSGSSMWLVGLFLVGAGYFIYTRFIRKKQRR